MNRGRIDCVRTGCLLLLLSVAGCASGNKVSGNNGTTGTASQVPDAATGGAIVVAVPPDPVCPPNTESSFQCEDLMRLRRNPTYPPPFEACPTSPRFSRRETESARARTGKETCCELRCTAQNTATDPY